MLKSSMKKIAPDRKEMFLIILAVCTAIFHLYTASIAVMPGYILTAVHWALIAAFIILTKPMKIKGGIIIDIALIAVTIYLSVYSVMLQQRIIFNPGVFSQIDYIWSVVAIVVALIIGVRALGWMLPTICVTFILYAFLGNHIPGMFQTVSFSGKRIATYLFSMTDGLYGMTLLVSAQYLFLFIFFGCIMDISGAGEFFVDIANSVAGRARGGPAQAAIYSSMLLGMVNGSGAANVATTGTFTIPLMKKTGYKPSMAGATEAASSCGGQIMPPVMGAVAFLMSETTGIAYSKIAIAAFVPAVLYYMTLSCSVYFTARRTNIIKPDPASLPSFTHTLKNGWFYLVALLILVYLIFSGYSAQKSVFWAIVSIFVVGLLFKRQNMTLENILGAAKKAAVNCGALASACMLAGIIMGMINLTGLGLKISSIIQTISGGNILISLLLAMLTSLLLGMGLPTSAAYVVLSVLVAPSLVNMGVSMIAAHLFILYFGAISTITPPVALSTFVASGISGAGIWETGRDALKLSIAGFLLPFIFAYNNALLLDGKLLVVVQIIFTSAAGCMLLAAAINGWFLMNLSMIKRILIVPCAIMLILVRPFWINYLGLALALIILVLPVLIKKGLVTNTQ